MALFHSQPRCHMIMFFIIQANNPVSVGKIRSKQQTLREGDYSLTGESSQGDKTLCVQVHGDGSFAGQVNYTAQNI